MTSLNEYQERINALAREKGWSFNLHWLLLGCYKELGELIAEIERVEARDRQRLPTEADYLAIEKEFGDVLFFLFQTMHHYDTIDLDAALEYVIKDNTERKKKIIDQTGKIVRK